MKRNILRGLTLLLFISASLEGSNSPIRERLMGAAYLDNQAYHLLEEMSDRFGGRITGSASNEQSMTFIQEALEKEGIKSWQESFTFPGWVRGKDEAVLIEPVNRPLRSDCTWLRSIPSKLFGRGHTHRQIEGGRNNGRVEG